MALVVLLLVEDIVLQKYGYFTLRRELHRVSLNGPGRERRTVDKYLLDGVLEDAPTAIAHDWLTGRVSDWPAFPCFRGAIGSAFGC